MPTTEKYEDNKPSTHTSSTTLDNASFVHGPLGKGVELSNTCPPSLSIVTSCPGSLADPINEKKTPPRPPRSPKRARLADITEEGSFSVSEDRKSARDLVDLRSVLAGFISRLEAVPPPESPDSPSSTYSCTSTTRAPSLKSRKRTQSLSILAEMEETDRSRTASDGTFGPVAGSRHGGQSLQEASTTDEEVLRPEPIILLPPATPLLPTSGGQSPISPLALGNLPEGDSGRSATEYLGRPGHKAAPTMPILHITRPSTSSDPPEPNAFEAIVDMMNKGDCSTTESKILAEQSSNTTPSVPGPREGKAQIRRKGMMGPSTILGESHLTRLGKTHAKLLSQSQILVIPLEDQETDLETITQVSVAICCPVQVKLDQHYLS